MKMMLLRSKSVFKTVSRSAHKSDVDRFGNEMDPHIREQGKERKVMFDVSEATETTRTLSVASFDDTSVVDVDEVIAMRHGRLVDIEEGVQSTTGSSTSLLERQEETIDFSDSNSHISDLWRNAEAERVAQEGSTLATGDRRAQMMRTDGFRVDKSRMDAIAQPPQQHLPPAASLLRLRSDRNTQDLTDVGHLSQDEFNFIQEILLRSFHLCSMALHDLVLAFERTEAKRHEVIISQGDTCDDGSHVYIVAEGECIVDVDGIAVPGPYGTYKPRSIFGELGVLHNATRAATISAKTERVVLYRACASAFTTAFQLQQPDDDDNKREEDEELLRQIDAAIDQVSGTKSLYGGDIIRQYQPGRLWLWSQWRGTILEHNIKTALAAMLLAALVTVIARLVVDPTWPIGGIPDDTHPVIQHLSQLRKCWQMVLPLVTFVLTFYVNQAYLVWQKTTVTSRQIQGRISDFSLVLAASCKRNPDGTYTEDSERLMDDVAASSRLFHALFWSKQARRFHCLSTPTGLARMAHRGMITPKQLQVLQSLSTPTSTYYSACLEWMMIRSHQGVEDNLVYSPGSVSLQLLELMCQLRSATAKLTDNLKSRMPLAYTHFVQVLVDTFVWSSPFVLYADLGMYSILSVGIIALFYTGLMDLAKLFLDPLNNQCFSSKAINMGMDLGVLTRESNDSSNHYKESGASIPFSIKTIN